MNNILAQKTVRDYVCSICWGHLLQHIKDGETIVECAKYGREHEGFTSKAFVERRQSDSVGEAMDVRHNLRDVIPTPHKGKTPEQLLDELGF